MDVGQTYRHRATFMMGNDVKVMDLTVRLLAPALGTGMWIVEVIDGPMAGMQSTLHESQMERASEATA